MWTLESLHPTATLSSSTALGPQKISPGSCTVLRTHSVLRSRNTTLPAVVHTHSCPRADMTKGLARIIAPSSADSTAPSSNFRSLVSCEPQKNVDL